MSSVVLVGSPNSGKSLLFNRLTGLNQKVANYPGITVDVREGELQGGDGAKVLDFPGTYSLQPISGEERVAVENFERLLAGGELAAVLCIVDATRLTKSLSFALQVARAAERAGRPVLLVANMIDVLDAHDVSFDAEGLAEALGLPVIPVSARTGAGIAALRARVDDLLASNECAVPAKLAAMDDVALAAFTKEMRKRLMSTD